MEHLEGETLQAMMDHAGKLPTQVVARLVMQSASALAACHKAAIIHRDLKPANFFIVEDPDVDGGVRVRILDFGIAKLVQQSQAIHEQAGHTRTGMVMGSPAYMSPEQCLDSKNVDQRTDIFSLGVMAYQMLSGELPFVADTLPQLALVHSRQHAKPLTELGVNLPEGLDRVILKALETDRDRRFESMEVLRKAVAAAMSWAPGSTLELFFQEHEADAEPLPEPEPAQPPTSFLKSTTLSATAGELPPMTQAPPASSRSMLVWAGVVGTVIAVVAVLIYVKLVDTSPAAKVQRAAASGAPRSAQPGPAARPTPGPAPTPSRGSGTAAVDHQASSSPAPAMVTVTLEPTPASAEVRVNGVLTPKGSVQLPRGKTHKIRVQAPGHTPHEQELMASADQTLRIKLRAVETTVAASTWPATVATNSRKRKKRSKKRKRKQKQPAAPRGVSPKTDEVPRFNDL